MSEIVRKPCLQKAEAFQMNGRNERKHWASSGDFRPVLVTAFCSIASISNQVCIQEPY